jgi:phage-related protein
MSNVVRNILVRVGSDINPMQRGLQDAQRSLAAAQRNLRALSGQAAGSMQSMSQSMSGARVASGLLKGAMAALAVTAVSAFAVVSKKGTEMAIEYEASLQQVNRILGANAADFIKWSNTQAIGFGMSRSEAVKYGAVYGNLMSSITSDSAEASKYTQQLLKASAVVASATGREMTDVMERIRSGLLGNTESIEDLGINVNIAMIESTNAFKQFANGKSWQQLSFQTQQQIRLFAILEQSTKKYGTEINQNTSSSISRLTATLKDAQLNLGQAFLPIINIIVPILTSFAENLKYVTGVFSQFMQVLFGVNAEQSKTARTTTASAKSQVSLGKAVGKAGDAAKKGVAGFDEVNQLQEQMAANAEDAAAAVGGGGGTTTTSSSNAISPPSGLVEFANKAKEALAPIAGFFREIGTGFSTFYTNVQPSLTIIGNTLTTLFNPAWSATKTVISAAAEVVKDLISGGLDILKGSLEIVAGIVSGNWQLAWEGTKTVLTGVKDVIIALPSAILSLGSQALTTASEFLQHNKTFQAHKLLIESIAGAITLVFLPALIKTGVESVIAAGKITVSFVASLIEASARASAMALIMTGQLIMSIVLYAKEGWLAAAAIVGQSVAWIANKAAIIGGNLAMIASIVATKALAAAQWLLNAAMKANPIGIVITVLAALTAGIIYLWNTSEGFRSALISAWKAIKTTAIDVWDSVSGKIKGLWNWISEKTGPIFTEMKDIINGAFGTVKTVVLKIWEDISTGIKSSISAVLGFIGKLIGGINAMIGKLNSLSFSIPEWVPGLGGKNFSLGIPLIDYKVPEMAKGGIVSSPTLAMIGEAGREAVLPMENGSAMDELAGRLGTLMMNSLQLNNQSNNQSNNVEAIFNLDGVPFARALIPLLNKEYSRIGSTAIIQTA